VRRIGVESGANPSGWSYTGPMVDHARDATLDGRAGIDDSLAESSLRLSGPELESPPEIAAGTSIGGRYEVIRRLGQGGMGAVYEAEHKAIQRRVAVKVLHPEFGRNPSVVERFMQEARAVNAVRHRNVVEVMDFGVDHGRPWLVMELLAGESLADRIARSGAGDPAWAVRVLDPVCRALHLAHQRGFIHRDVKPDNVFLVSEEGGEEVPKLLDFGIAKNLVDDRKLTATGTMVGTPAYMAPEQITDPKGVTPACDQYSVAAMAYEMMTARLPHEAETFHGMLIAKVQGAGTPLLDRRPDLPPALSAAVMRALALNPAERFPDIDAFRLALHASLAQMQSGVRAVSTLPLEIQAVVAKPAAPVVAAPAVEPEPALPVNARSRWWIAAVLVPVAVGALLLGLSQRSTPPAPAIATPRPPVPTLVVAPVAVTPPAAPEAPPPAAPPAAAVAPVAVAAPVQAPAHERRSHGHRDHSSPETPRPHGRLRIDNHNPLR
jgi:tRNA A-37 threonylcarbamoyl transferase component Bud32